MDSNDQPKVGDTRIYNHRKQIFAACNICGKPRWVVLCKGKPRNANHNRCAMLLIHQDKSIQEKRRNSIKKSWTVPTIAEAHCKAQTRRWSKLEQREHQRLKMLRANGNSITKFRRRKSLIAWHKKLETKEKMRLGSIRQYSRPEVHKKHSIVMTNRYKDPREREKSRQITLKRYENPVERYKTGLQSKERWADPEYKDRTLNAMFRGMNLKPNKPELLIMDLLNTYFPNEWVYTGDGKTKFKIKHKIPDFVHASKKWVIEHFGNHIHTTLAKKYHQTEKGRIELFSEAGYKTLVLWDITQRNKDKALQRIKEFFYSTNK